MVEALKKRRLTIAIDGPSGAGKGTAGKLLAKRLGYTYIDTGAMYRAVALQVKEKAMIMEDEEAISVLASSLRIRFSKGNDETRVLCNGRDVTEAIRSPEISLLASDISKKRGVRETLVQMQREMGRGGGVVLEGRDIGTVVFPGADVKFYLDASTEERARRRFLELVERGMRVEYEKTLRDVIQRDQNDMSRALSPLKKAEDAVVIDSTHHSVEEVVAEMIRIVNDKEKWQSDVFQ